MTNEEYRIHHEAMRANLAGQVFVGLMANDKYQNFSTASLVKDSVRLADDLLEELRKPGEPRP
jgi:hypothetical protein